MSNYSESETTYMVQLYQENPCAETVDLLVEQLKEVRNLSLGSYHARVYTGGKCMSQRLERNLSQKLEIVSNIAESLGLEVGTLAGLEKSPKGVYAHQSSKSCSGGQQSQEALSDYGTITSNYTH